MIKKTYKLVKVDYTDSGYFYIKNVSNEVGGFRIIFINGTIQYSTDGVNWVNYNMTTKPTINVNPNSNIYLRGSGASRYNSGGSEGFFSFDKDYIIGGNFMSVPNYATMNTVTTIDSTNRVTEGFKNDTHLISASDLNFGNVTTVKNQGLISMFHGCTNLKEAPDLSSITTIYYGTLNAMFYGCTSLTKGVDLSNITSIEDGSINSIYNGCKKISEVTTPNIQNLTTSVLSSWLQNAGTQATGTKTVNVPTGATITADSISGIPTGWTRVDY